MSGGGGRRDILVVVPTYNERENIVPFLAAVLEAEPRADLLVVDDSSPDGTGALVAELASREPRLHLLERAGKEGIGPAYVAGFRWALERAYATVVQMDADFSHRPEDLGRLLDAAEGADVVIGSRRVPGGAVANWSWARRLLSGFGSWYARTLLGLPVHDCTSGFKAIRRSALEALDLGAIRANGYAFQVELLHAWSSAGCSLKEVPILFPDRVHGRSKMSLRIGLEAALLVVRMRFGGARRARRRLS